jgi:hypothetical protein
VGGTEGGLIGMFVAYGAPLDLAAAAVLGYRVFQLGLPTLLGAISLLRIRYVLAHPPSREAVAARFAPAEQRAGGDRRCGGASRGGRATARRLPVVVEATTLER